MSRDDGELLNLEQGEAFAHVRPLGNSGKLELTLSRRSGLDVEVLLDPSEIRALIRLLETACES